MSLTDAAVQPGWLPVDTFGARLALVRQQMGGWNLKRAADECEISRANWAKWERGASPRNMHEVVSMISRRTGVSREWLMWGGPLATPTAARTSVTPLELVNTQRAALVFELRPNREPAYITPKAA